MKSSSTRNFGRLAIAFTLASGLTAVPARLQAGSPRADRRVDEMMTKGKLESDLGNHRVAIEAFEAVSRDESAPPAARWEALVRLGTARRRSGDHEGSVRAYQQVLSAFGSDPEAIRFMALAVEGVVPGKERWDRIWKDVKLSVHRGEAGVLPYIVWPEGVSADRRMPYQGSRISLDLEEADLGDTLKRFGELTGLKLAIDPGVGGTVTMHVGDLPWDEALERIIACQGLTYALEGGVLRVFRAQRRAGAVR